MTRPRTFRPVPLLALLALAGCMIGPDYRGPPRVAPAAEDDLYGFRRTSVAPVNGASPLARWWTALGDDTLNRLEADALAHSPTLERAAGVIRESRASVRQSFAALLPQGGIDGAYARVDAPGAINDALGAASAAATAGGGAGGMGATAAGSAIRVPDHLNLYSLAGLATWELDLFGGARRQLASARASLEASEIDLQDAQVTLTREVATAYVNLRDAQRRLDLARRNTAVQERMLALVRLRRRGGTASDLDVERTFSQLKQTQANVVPLQGQVEIYTDQLSQLTGHEPGTHDALVAAARSLPLPPVQTAVGDPADMLRRRPDVRAAERRLKAANETIGANIAQYFPTVTLYGSLGYGSTKIGNLLAGKNLLKLGAPVLSWNFLSFPQISAQVEQSRGQFDQARATYRSTVLSALLDAENALSRYGHQRDNVQSLADASASADRTKELADLRLRGGTISLSDALDVERQRIEAESSLAQAQASLTSDWIMLQSSLGLGWVSISDEHAKGRDG